MKREEVYDGQVTDPASAGEGEVHAVCLAALQQANEPATQLCATRLRVRWCLTVFEVILGLRAPRRQPAICTDACIHRGEGRTRTEPLCTGRKTASSVHARVACRPVLHQFRARGSTGMERTRSAGVDSYCSWGRLPYNRDCDGRKKVQHF